MAILAELTSDDVLDTAYGWLCKRRRKYPADADVWSFRQSWPQEKDRLKAALAAGDYHFGLLIRVTLKDGEEIDLWSARDALVLKAIAIVLGKVCAPVDARSSPLSRALRPQGGATSYRTPDQNYCRLAGFPGGPLAA